MVQWYMPAGIARCLDNSRGNMFQPTCSAPPRKENARGNKRKNANVSVSRGKYPVFDLLHSPQSMGDQCTNAPFFAKCQSDFVQQIWRWHRCDCHGQTLTNTWFNLDKYILQFGEIHFVANLKATLMWLRGNRLGADMIGGICDMIDKEKRYNSEDFNHCMKLLKGVAPIWSQGALI